MGYESKDIIKYAEFALRNTEDLRRNEIMRVIISIVRGQDERSNKS